MKEFEYNGIDIYNTKHADDRTKQRKMDIQDRELLETHYKGFIDYIIEKDLFGVNQDYMVYSNGLGRGLIYNFDGDKTLDVITVLPTKPYFKTKAKQGTRRLAMETNVSDIPENIVEYIHDIFDYELPTDEYEEVVLDFDGNEYESYFLDGEIYLINGLDFVETK